MSITQSLIDNSDPTLRLAFESEAARRGPGTLNPARRIQILVDEAWERLARFVSDAAEKHSLEVGQAFKQARLKREMFDPQGRIRSGPWLRTQGDHSHTLPILDPPRYQVDGYNSTRTYKPGDVVLWEGKHVQLCRDGYWRDRRSGSKIRISHLSDKARDRPAEKFYDLCDND